MRYLFEDKNSLSADFAKSAGNPIKNIISPADDADNRRFFKAKGVFEFILS